MSATETRHYIGVTPLGRLHMTLGPDEPSKFKTAPTEPLTLENGNVLYPVSAEVAEEFDADYDCDTGEDECGGPGACGGCNGCRSDQELHPERYGQ